MSLDTEQNFKNHAKYYTLHHFIFYPVLLIATAAATICVFKFAHLRIVFILIDVLFVLLGWTSFMMRQHYALGNQNRIIRLEMRLRYYQLTQQKFEPIEQQLTFSQIAALRFAPDGEFIPLLQRTVKENLSSKEIKKSIVHWFGDHMRV